MLILLCGRGVLRLALSYEDGLIIDWGDGTTTTREGTNTRYQTSKTYSTDGDYYVTIIGNLKDIAFYWKYSSGSWTTRNTTALKAVLTPLPKTMSDVTTCNQMFVYSSVQSVHPGLFSKMPNVTEFRGLFTMAPLKEIPETLFKWCPLATDFNACFRQTSVETIPEKLFENNPMAEDFGLCFESCAQLTDVPGDLFANNPDAKSFYQCFQHTNKLVSVPGNLFTNNVVAEDFSYCFANSGVKEVGSGLFYNNLMAEYFNNCFMSDDRLVFVGDNMFRAGGAAINFSSFMSGCNQIGNYAPRSSVPELWTMYPNAAHDYAFRNCSSAANYYQIPNDWK